MTCFSPFARRRIAWLSLAAALALCPTTGAMLAAAALPAPLLHGPAVVHTLFSNGLVLVSKEVHSAPVVSVWVYYRVGSRDEGPGLYGISHQVEHMMFKGTHKLRPGDIDRLFSERGGENNAMTTQDYTAYNETLPASALPVALAVEADRMENSLMDAGELTHEKQVVLSELEGDENSPLYRLDTAVAAAAFQAHPYHNPVGGYLYDVRMFTQAEVAHYYATHYAPNNAVLVVVGDFNTQALRKVVAHDFSHLPQRAIFNPTITPELKQSGERRITIVGVGDTSYVEMAYHVPATGKRGHYVMDVISSVLGSGKSSRLYQALVQKGLATEVDAGDPDMQDPYLMLITATVAPGHTQQEVEDAIEAEIDRLKGEPVSAEELQKTINQVRAGFVYRDDSVTSQGSDLGYYGALGLYHYLDTYIKKIESVSPLEIQATAELYLDQDNRTVGWFIPRPARPGEAVPTEGRGGGLHYKAWPPEQAGKPWQQQAFPVRPLALRTAAGVTPDSARLMGRRRRQGSSSRKTALKAAPLSTLLKELTPADNRSRPMPIRHVLPNGLVVIVFPNHSNPDISISGSVRTGAFYDPPDKAGLANFTASMLDRGTTTRTEEDLASELDFVGASVDVSAGGGGTFFTAHCLDDDLSLTLGILADEIRNPTFPPQSFDQMRNILATEIQEGDDDPSTVASRGLFGALYPPDYPLHWPPIGTTETLNHITRDDLQAFHDRYYRPDLISLVIVGDVDPRAAIARVEDAFGDWATSGPPPSLVLPPRPPATAARRIVKTMPDKSEAVVAMGFPGISRKDHIYYPAYLMNLILGNDDFNSRLMKDIRDRKGLAYYVGSSWDAGALAGPWLLQMESSPANVDRAIRAAIMDIEAMQAHGPKPEEMKLFKGWVAGNQALQLETDAGIADMVEQSEYYGLGMDYLWHYPAIINSVTSSQVWYAARKFLRPHEMMTSIAGPYAERPGAVGPPATQPGPPLGTIPSTGPMGNPGDAGLHAQPEAGAGGASAR